MYSHVKSKHFKYFNPRYSNSDKIVKRTFLKKDTPKKNCLNLIRKSMNYADTRHKCSINLPLSHQIVQWILYTHTNIKFPTSWWQFLIKILSKTDVKSFSILIFVSASLCIFIYIFFWKLIVAEVGWKNIKFFFTKSFLLVLITDSKFVPYAFQHENNLNHEAKIIYHYQFSLHFLSFINFQFNF